MIAKNIVPDSDAKEVRQRMPAEERALPGQPSCSNLEPQSKENWPQNREFTLTLRGCLRTVISFGEMCKTR